MQASSLSHKLRATQAATPQRVVYAEQVLARRAFRPQAARKPPVSRPQADFGRFAALQILPMHRHVCGHEWFYLAPHPEPGRAIAGLVQRSLGESSSGLSTYSMHHP